MNSCLFYFTIICSSVTAQWNPLQQSWPTHPPQTGSQPTSWNNQWNNAGMWGTNTGHTHSWNRRNNLRVFIPTTTPEPPDSPPQQIVVVHAPPQPSGPWQNPQAQNPGWMPPNTNNFSPGWGSSHGQQPSSWGGPMTNNFQPPWGQQSPMNRGPSPWETNQPQPSQMQHSMSQNQNAPWERQGQSSWNHNNNQPGWNPVPGQMTPNNAPWNQPRQPPPSHSQHGHMDSQHVPPYRQPPQPHMPMLPRHDTGHPHQQHPTNHQHPEPHVAPEQMTEHIPYPDPNTQIQHHRPPTHRQEPPESHHPPPSHQNGQHHPPDTQHHTQNARPDHQPYPPHQEKPYIREQPVYKNMSSHKARAPPYRQPDHHNDPAYSNPDQHHYDPAYGPQEHHNDPAYRQPDHHQDPTYRQPDHRQDPAYRQPEHRQDPSYHQPAEHQDPAHRPPEHRYDPAHGPPDHPQDPAHRPPDHHQDPAHRPPEHHQDPAHRPPDHRQDPAHRPPEHRHDPAHRQPEHRHDPAHRQPEHRHDAAHRQNPAYRQPEHQHHDPSHQSGPAYTNHPEQHRDPHNSLPEPTPMAYPRTTTQPPPAYEHYVQSQLGPPALVTSDPTIRVHNYLADVSHVHNNPPVWPDPSRPRNGQHPPNVPAHLPPNAPVQHPPNAPVHLPPNAPVHLPPNAPVHLPPNAPVQQPPNAPVHLPPNHPAHNTVYKPSPTTHQPLHHQSPTAIPSTAAPSTTLPLDSLMNLDPAILAALSAQEIMMLAEMVKSPTPPSFTTTPVITTQNTSVAVLTPPTLKYGVTHPDGSVTEEVYTLVASRVQRIVSMTTSLIKRMTAYIVFDRNRGTFALRSRFVKDICYAGFLDDDVTSSFREVVNKTKQVAFPHINGNDKIFFYKEEEQILFSDALREAGHYVAGSCGKDSVLFRVSRVRNPDTQIGPKVIPGDACPFGPPFRQSFYSVARCQNGTCPVSHTCNLQYDICCPDMPPSTECFPFSLGNICITYMPGRRIVD